jgi:hypothetical protein
MTLDDETTDHLRADLATEQRKIGMELADFLADEKLLAESNLEFYRRHGEIDVSPVEGHIAILTSWEAMLRELFG